jgi:segregation and condensation protein A
MAGQADVIGWTIHTEVFDGPLDLLLYLVRRDGVDLRRIDVRQITDSYLAYLERMRELNLSLAGDYLVMAATLVHLKSLELLPRLPTVVAEEEDPREALARQLREYAGARTLADDLGARPMVGRDVFTRAPQGLDGERHLDAGLDAFGLLDLYWQLLSRAEEPEPVVELHIVTIDFAATCRSVLSALGGKGGTGELNQMLRSLDSRAQMVVTFIAVLEMVSQGWIDVRQDAHDAPVQVIQVVDRRAIDLGAITGWVEAGDADPVVS